MPHTFVRSRSLATSVASCLLALACAAPLLATAQTRPQDDPADMLRGAGTGTGTGAGTAALRPGDSLNTLNRDLLKSTAPASTTTQKPATAVRTRTPAAPEPRTQFQTFVLEATGKNLQHFGSALFDNPDNYLPDESLPVPANYVLGPGDEVQLQVWGAVDFSTTLVLDRNGKVLIPKVGSVALAGVAVRDLEPTLRASLGKVFNNFSLNANLARLRSIQIYVMGQARQPGTYVVSSLSTLVNALFISGGPNASGSMRRIQLQRDGKTISQFDLYDLIARGDKSRDVALQPGDVIVIPPAGPRVAVTGAFDQAAIYELKDAFGTVGELLSIHGGTPTLASTHKALLERVQPDRTPARQVVELPLNASGLQQTLRDADVLTLLPIGRAFGNAVTLRGNVAQPLRYAFKPGMRVADLIPEPEALIQPDYYSRKNMLVQTEAGQPPAGERTANDVRNLLQEINWDYAAIERLDAAEVRTVLIPFNLGKAVKAKDPVDNLLLQAGDVVTIFSVNDLPVPAEKRTQFVRVGGEVMVPGVYQIQPGDTLPDLIQRAGGLSKNAFVYGTEFTRESTRAQQQANLNKSIRQMEADINAQTATLLQNVTGDEKGNIVQAQIAGQKAMLGRLQGLRASGRIALDLNHDQPALPPLRLEGGDRIIVPQRPSFVGVFGEVYAENSFIHKPEQTVADYLDKAGVTRDADMDNVTLIRADGTVETGRQGFSLWGPSLMARRLYAGDTIFVPARIDRRSAYSTFIQGAKDWTAIFYQFGLGAAGLKTLQ